MGAREGISPLILDFREDGIVVPHITVLYGQKKLNEKWQLIVDYRKLNANTEPLTAAVPNMAELIAITQEQPHPVLAIIDVKDVFFMAPLQGNAENVLLLLRAKQLGS